MNSVQSDVSPARPALFSRLGRTGTVALAMAVMCAIGGWIAPQSLSATSLVTMLPFAAILAVAALGQHLVVQQRGLDMSVAGIISLTCVLVTALPSRDAGVPTIMLAIAVGLAAGAGVGLVNGICVAMFRIPPLVATIGVNALAIGGAVYLSGGVPSAAPDMLSALALGSTMGIPNIFLVAAVVVGLVGYATNRTVMGRRFLATGINPEAGRSLGFPVGLQVCATYALAGMLFAAAAVLHAAFVAVPTVMSGNEYMLATVAAVIVGGNSLAGGRNSVIATLLGVLFLTYINQFVLSVGLGRALQDVVKAAIIILGIALPVFTSARRH